MFCDPCKDDTTGAFVDLQIQMEEEGSSRHMSMHEKKWARIEDNEAKAGKGQKGANGNKEEGKDGKRHSNEERAWDLEEGETLDLTSRVRIDGNWTNMPEGFPKFVNEGGKQYYTLRFPKFTDNAWYALGNGEFSTGLR